MPDHTSRRSSEFQKFDTMPTEQLRQILREDASKPAGEGSDTEMIFYVMEVLARRKKELKEGKTPEEALETFKSKYYTENEISSVSENTVGRTRRSGGWKRGLVAAAAVLVLVIGSSITASALGFDLWGIIAKWTQETFHFGYAGQVDEGEEPGKDVALPYSQLQDALDELNIQTALVPTWIPEGYVEVEVKVTESPKHRAFSAKYQCSDKIIIIRLAEYLDGYPMQIEQSDSLLEVYTSNEIDYYIFDNLDNLKAVWINENFECYISGPLSVSEIKEMIDSIGKG